MSPSQDDFDKLLDKLTASTHSPRGRFSAQNSWNLLEERVTPPKRKAKLLRIVSAVAASVLLCLAGWYVYEYMQPISMQTASTLADVCIITLPDQTKVTLNRYSSLTYPTRFKGKEREVQLVGEAYFEVERDVYHPFIVKVDMLDVQVLGTHFNVEAYPDDIDIKTTLLEGSVAVRISGESQELVLFPNESAVYNRLENRLKHEITPESTTEIVWRDGHFLFDYIPLQEIARQLSHAFNVKIEIENSDLKNYRMRAHFTHGENLEQILDLLQTTGNFTYTKTNNKIFISTKLN